MAITEVKEQIVEVSGVVISNNYYIEALVSGVWEKYYIPQNYKEAE